MTSMGRLASQPMEWTHQNAGWKPLTGCGVETESTLPSTKAIWLSHWGSLWGSVLGGRNSVQLVFLSFCKCLKVHKSSNSKENDDAYAAIQGCPWMAVPQNPTHTDYQVFHMGDHQISIWGVPTFADTPIKWKNVCFNGKQDTWAASKTKMKSRPGILLKECVKLNCTYIEFIYA